MAHRHAIRPPRNAFERVQRADVHRGVDQEPIFGDAGQDLLRGFFRRYRVAAEPATQRLTCGIVAVDAGDLDGVHQRGLDRARHHHRHPDAVSGQVEAQYLGESAQPELAGAVGGMPGQPDQPGRRGHVDQMSAIARRHHRGHEVLDDVDRAHQVDRDHLVPLLVGQPVDGPPRRNPGDVHHDVHARVLGMNRRRRTRRPRRSWRHPAPGTRGPVRPVREHRPPSAPDRRRCGRSGTARRLGRRAVKRSPGRCRWPHR